MQYTAQICFEKRTSHTWMSSYYIIIGIPRSARVGPEFRVRLYGFRNSEFWLNNFRNSGFLSYGFRNSEPGSQDSWIISKIRNSGIHSGSVDIRIYESSILGFVVRSNEIRILFHVPSYEFSKTSTRIKSGYSPKWLQLWWKMISHTQRTPRQASISLHCENAHFLPRLRLAF